MDSADLIRDWTNIGQVRQWTNLSRLCALCDGLCFDYVDKYLNGEKVAYGGMVRYGDDLRIHHKGLEALRYSAEDGCHLCTLMFSALRWRATPTADGAPIHEEVTVGVDWEYFRGIIQIFLLVSCCNKQTKIVLERGFPPGVIDDRPPGPFWGSRDEHYLRLTEIDSDPSSDRIFSQITSWLRDCSSTHRRCHSMEAGTPLLPTRVIDVGPPDGQQDPPMFTTTLSELDCRVSEISMPELPRKFQDTVEITRKLHIRYLWIDSLCIIQDSARDWEQEATQMGKYYANAWLTISADAAEDSHGGILNQRNVLEIRSCKYPRLLNSGRDFQEGNFFLPNIGSFIENVEEGILSKRGWILQERILSRRILHWCRHELYWECTELQASERCPGGSGRTLWKGHHIAPLLRTSQTSRSLVAAWPIQTSPGLESQSTDLSPAVYKLRPQLLDDAYKFWYELLEDFCKRNLTQASDKLPAISGLASSFESLFLSDTAPVNGYVAGLWASDFPIGLAWRSHLFEWAPRLFQNSRFHCQEFVSRNHRVPVYRAPSFSWAAVDGPIEHPYLGAIMRGATSVPGFEPDVLDVQITPAPDADLFGRVTSGRVKLSGVIKALKDPPEGTVLYLDECSEANHISTFSYRAASFDSAFERWTHLQCFCLGVVKRDDKYDPTARAFCLLLEATGHEQEEYRRVGFLEHVNSMWFEGCARSDISLV
jgi:hypothetical protein